MQTSPLIPGSKELISQGFQMPPSSSVFSRGSLAPTDTITFHSEAQPSEQESSQASTSSLTDCFSSVLAFVQNIPSSLWNFFTGIVSYCLSFCYAPDVLNQEQGVLSPEKEAARVFLATRYEGTSEEKQTAFLEHYNALPPAIKRVFFEMCSSQAGDPISSMDLTAEPVTKFIQETLIEVTKHRPVHLKLIVHAWLIQKELSAFNSIPDLAYSNLTAAQITTALEAFENTIGHSDNEIRRVNKETYLTAVEALPGGVKEYLYAFYIWYILLGEGRKEGISMTDVNLDLNTFVLETINPTSPVEANKKIGEHIIRDLQYQVPKDIRRLIWLKEREAAALSRASG